ncbi:hypothetical protein FB478_1011227 [Arthrobacter sp. AG367]|nr:hypothetical protein FB478_1011227 [Arthrobacter sp. AG367]
MKDYPRILNSLNPCDCVVRGFIIYYEQFVIWSELRQYGLDLLCDEFGAVIGGHADADPDIFCH